MTTEPTGTKTIGAILGELPARISPDISIRTSPMVLPQVMHDKQRRPWPTGMTPDMAKFSNRRIEFLRKELDKNVWPLYLHGPAGRQKTMCAALMYVEFGGNPCVFLRCGDLYKDMNEIDGKRSSIRATMRDYSLVVLDDIADRNMTDARRAALLDILNWRDGRPLMLTGNYAPQSLADALVDDRLTSRILGGKSLLFEGPDMRLAGMTSVKVPN